MTTTSMNVLAPGHLRLTVGETTVEILGNGKLHVAAFSGKGAIPHLTYTSDTAKTSLREALVGEPGRTDFEIAHGLPAERQRAIQQEAPAPRSAPTKAMRRMNRRKSRASAHNVRHVLGESAPGQNHPMRYAVNLISRRRPSLSAYELDHTLGDIRRLTNMTITPAEGESPSDTHVRAIRELKAWFEVYAHEKGLPANPIPRKPAP